MAETAMIEETQRTGAPAGRTDLLIAIPAPLGGEALASTIAKLTQACRLLSTPIRTMLALPGEVVREEPTEIGGTDALALSLRFINYPPPPVDPNAIPWLANAAAYRTIAALAGRLGAHACTVLGTDTGLNRDSLTAEKLALLLDPALEGNFDLAMPVYSTQPFDDLVNKSILYPLTRALYGHRVLNPLGNEFQMSSKLFTALGAEAHKDSGQAQSRLPWPATLAANRNMKICQVRLGTRRTPSADGIELSDALTQLAGPLFLDMEENAAFWQRIRGSQDVPTFGNVEIAADAPEPVDARRMLEAFQLGVRNLREIWSLILPPVTLLELTKLSRRTAEEFHMEDSLWAHVVYDFALAHRLRNIRRAHLFGALTPIYLGWVASYATEMNRGGIATAQQRLEQLARTFESEKPYLLSRWRWPDRFQP